MGRSVNNQKLSFDAEKYVIAGAAAVDISPRNVQFMAGYPFVERRSTGIHDPLKSSALYISDGTNPLLFISNDVIFIPKDLARRSRLRIEEETGVPLGHILVSATHTHSGPRMVDYITHRAEPGVPPADPDYLGMVEEGIVSAAVKAFHQAGPAELGMAVGRAEGIGGNRRNPEGPVDLDVPVLAVRSAGGTQILGLMLVCCMHPTVLHEDSTLISADFPGMARRYLQESLSSPGCPVVHHTGPCGDQSPRHVTRANTVEEATRLGEILGRAVENTFSDMTWTRHLSCGVSRSFVELDAKDFLTVEQAEAKLVQSVQRLDQLRKTNVSRSEIRTAECDWFGAQHAVSLAKASRSGRVDEERKNRMPAEIQVFRLGDWNLVSWPGEVFVDYGLQIRQAHPHTFVVTLANGELHGYIVTPEASEAGGYEACNALFDARSGAHLVKKTLEMLTSPEAKNPDQGDDP